MLATRVLPHCSALTALYIGCTRLVPIRFVADVSGNAGTVRCTCVLRSSERDRGGRSRVLGRADWSFVASARITPVGYIVRHHRMKSGTDRSFPVGSVPSRFERFSQRLLCGDVVLDRYSLRVPPLP